MAAASADLGDQPLMLGEDEGMELETLQIHSPAVGASNEQQLHHDEQAHGLYDGYSHEHDHEHDHDHERDHGHGHDHGHSCGSFEGGTHARGWRNFLPHSHGLEQRLQADWWALLRAGMILSFAVVGQLIAGLIGNSEVLIVEAMHSLLDGMNVLLALLSVYLAGRPPTLRMTYGYARAEVLSALVSVLGVALLCFKLSVEAIGRLYNFVHGTKAKIHVEGKVVFIAEAVTLVANGAMAYVLSRNQSSLNIRALRAHVIADCIENVVVLFAGLLMWAIPKASVIDPVLTLIIVAVLVSVNTKIARETLLILMQAAPSFMDVEAAAAELKNVRGVASLGPLNAWTLTSGTVVATSVAKLDAKLKYNRRSIREAFNNILRRYGATVTIVEMDDDDDVDVETGTTEYSNHNHYDPPG